MATSLLVQEAAIREMHEMDPRLGGVAAYALSIPRQVGWQSSCGLCFVCSLWLFSREMSRHTQPCGLLVPCLAKHWCAPPAHGLPQDLFEQSHSLDLPSPDSVLPECPGDLEALLGQEEAQGGAGAGDREASVAVGSVLHPPGEAAQLKGISLAELDFIDADELAAEQHSPSHASSSTAPPSPPQAPTVSCLWLVSALGSMLVLGQSQQHC